MMWEKQQSTTTRMFDAFRAINGDKTIYEESISTSRDSGQMEEIRRHC